MDFDKLATSLRRARREMCQRGECDCITDDEHAASVAERASEPQPNLSAAVPHQFTTRMDGSINDYHVAPSGEGPLAFTWEDKPHRLLYDLLGEIQALRQERSAAVQTLEKAQRYIAASSPGMIARFAHVNALISEALAHLPRQRGQE